MQRLLPILILALCSCSASHEWRRSADPRPSLASATVYVAVPANGSYGEIKYPNSGAQTAAAVEEALRAASIRTERGAGGADGESVEAALAGARAHSCAFVLVPTIVHWEDRATEWSMISDRLEVKLELLDAHTGQVLDTSSFEAESSIWTFGGDHPQDMLREPLQEYVAGFP